MANSGGRLLNNYKYILTIFAILAVTSGCKGSLITFSSNARQGASKPPISFDGISSIDSPSETRIRLNFAAAVLLPDVAAITKYNVYQDGDSTNPKFVIDASVVVEADEGFFITLSGFDVGAEYSFLLRASNGQLEDPNEVWVSYLIPDTSGENPVFSGIDKALFSSKGQVELSWVAASDNHTNQEEIQYKIFRSTSATDFDFSAPYDSVVGETAFVDKSPVASSVSWYVVRAIDADSNSDGNSISASVATYPKVVFNGLEAVEALSHDTVQLTLTPASGGTGSFEYHVFLNGEVILPFSIKSGLVANNSGKIQFLVGGLSIGTTYSFLVRAFDSPLVGTGLEDVNTISIIGTTANVLKPVFSGVSSMAPLAGISGKTALKIIWPDATPADGTTISTYEVYFGTALPLDLTVPTQVLAGTNNELTISSLTENTEYFAIVRATDSNGNQDSNMETKQATTNVSGVISFSGAVSAIPPPTTSGFTELNVSWAADASGDFDQYDIFISTLDLASNDPAGGWASPTVTVPSTQTGATLSALTANTLYYVVVRASFSGDSSNDGNRVAVQGVTSPPAPSFAGIDSTEQAYGVPGLTSVTLNWLAGGGVFDNYYIYRKSGTYDFDNETASVGSGLLTWTDTGLTTDTEYCYVVRAVYAGVAPLPNDGNTLEFCATPQLQPIQFAGISSCTAASAGAGIDTLDIAWPAALGVFDEYAVWGPSTSAINFGAAADSVVSANILTLQSSGLTPGTLYHFGVRARYTVDGSFDANNSVDLTCTTKTAYANWSVEPIGAKFEDAKWVPEPEVCLEDIDGNISNLSGTINLTVSSGSGALIGTTSVATTAGCAKFPGVRYDTNETYRVTASAAGVESAETSSVVNNWDTDYNIIFTTIGVHQGDFGGISGGDAICQAEATAAGLTDTYVSFISTSASNAIDRIKIDGPVYNLAGDIVEDSIADFYSSPHDNAVDYNSTGALAPTVNVWTGTGSSGVISTTNCTDFTTTAVTGRYGIVSSESTWASSNHIACTNTYSLLCISQNEGSKKLDAFTVAATATDREVDLTLDFGVTTDFDHIDIRRKNGDLPPSVLCDSGDLVGAPLTVFTDTTISDPTNTDSINYSYRLCIYDSGSNLIGTNTAVNVQPAGTIHTIFVTDQTWDGAGVGGLAGADTKCQAAGDSAALGGTYKAIMGDSSTSAKSRLTISGPIFNVMETRIANDSVDLWDSSLDSGIIYDQHGTVSGLGASWTGSLGDGTVTPTSCTDWTTTAGTGHANRGPSYVTGHWVSYTGNRDCATSKTLICISQ
jgi:hypothetical protein